MEAVAGLCWVWQQGQLAVLKGEHIAAVQPDMIGAKERQALDGEHLPLQSKEPAGRAFNMIQVGQVWRIRWKAA